MGNAVLVGNTIRAGLVWSGSLRGSVDTAVPAAQRKAMSVTVGSKTNTSLVEVVCAAQPACSPIKLSVGADTYNGGDGVAPITLAWAVFSTNVPPAPKWQGSWTGWKFDLNYAASGLAVPAVAYALWVYFTTQTGTIGRKPGEYEKEGESHVMRRHLII